MLTSHQKLIFLGAGCCVFMLLIGWSAHASLDSPSVSRLVNQLGFHSVVEDNVVNSPSLWDPERYLNGPPTPHLRGMLCLDVLVLVLIT